MLAVMGQMACEGGEDIHHSILGTAIGYGVCHDGFHNLKYMLTLVAAKSSVLPGHGCEHLILGKYLLMNIRSNDLYEPDASSSNA